VLPSHILSCLHQYLGCWFIFFFLVCFHLRCASPFNIKSTVTDHYFFPKFTKLFNNIIFRNRFVARTHTPRQNKDDSTFEQGSNKTVIAIKNKNAISGCHGNQHSRTPGNVVKHATEHKAPKQVKRLFIRLQHVVQCPLVRARQTRTGSNPRQKMQVPVPIHVPREPRRSGGTGARRRQRTGRTAACRATAR